MPPAPKRPSTRRRRHHYPGAATLTPVDPAEVEIPPLPEDRDWHPRTIERWAAVRRSPMFAEYDPSDLPGLLDLADLWDRRHRAEKDTDAIRLSAEIRLQEQRYGLSPLDRRRLSWEIDRGETAEQRTRRRRNRAAATEVSIGSDDPLAALVADEEAAG